MHETNLFPKPEIASKIVRCIEDAVGDDIRADIQLNDLQTTNSRPSRIWDFLNTNLIKNLGPECISSITHRGPWEMVVIFEKDSQNIITLMREERFAEIKKKRPARKNMHYIDMLAMHFNSDLTAEYQQQSFLPHIFSDEDRCEQLAAVMLDDLRKKTELIRHHVIVLFESKGFNLLSARAVMITSDLEIAKNGEQNLSQYISASESTIIEKIDNPQSFGNQPAQGLSLKGKALKRKENHIKTKEQKDVVFIEG